MGQTWQDDARSQLSRPGEPGLTTTMVEKGMQQQQLPSCPCRLYVAVGSLSPTSMSTSQLSLLLLSSDRCVLFDAYSVTHSGLTPAALVVHRYHYKYADDVYVGPVSCAWDCHGIIQLYISQL